MKLLVIGNGMVGQRLLEQLVEAAQPSAAAAQPSAATRPLPAAEEPSLQITVLGEEPRAAYDRVHLTAFFSGRSAADLSLPEPGFFEQHGITLRLAERAVRIDRARHEVRGASGCTYGYDRLVIATGSAAFVPPIGGRERSGCFVYRRIEDVEAIREAARDCRSGTVIGGGLLGLEAAKALTELGLRTSVVESAPRLMAAQIDEPGAQMLRARIAALGIDVHTGRNTIAITDGDAAAGETHDGARGGRLRLMFADGGELQTDLVVFSAGIRPRDELAREAGLAVGERGGIVIDDTCRTCDPDIYAIGECALWEGRIFGLVGPGYQMAGVAAAHLAAAADVRFTGADSSTKLKLLGVDVASIGDAHGQSAEARVCSFIDERRQVYKKLVISADGSRLLGGILVGEAEQYGTLVQMVQNRLPLPAQPEQLILATATGTGTAAAGGAHAATGLTATADGRGGTGELPDGAQICSCNGVSKGALCAAVAAGATTLGALKKATRAASTCGGCASLVDQILKAELARRGAAVDNHLCEHFPYTRQELFHLVRVGALRSFEALLARHGRGLGCDLCKPAAASILASCWNDFVLAPEQAPLQDSNDYFLANIQKDGSYSVVPRIPGGEVTPEQLIAIGSIARKFQLYTKITGGQRIDLFGAQVHELPLIWRELVDAGFESGHAYGKAVRTVKSCVGSTWCRYGVQDSVGLAIRIENRYKGLRSPHKLKFAVSGCTRECAEAQGKDVGVIATEKGWNLYVCGNGGMKPRHAELLAADLDEATLIRYVDRFLMFYIRTADRLQRTSVWREHLQGGLDYLRAAVCEDRLGIAAELEADMQRIVDGYQCEWRRAIEDPQALRRFRHFINSERADERPVYLRERGQRRPASAAERARLAAPA